MFQLLQHCLLVVSSVIAHLFYPKNGQATIGLAYTLSKMFADLPNIGLAVTLVFKQPFLTQTLFECLKRFEGFFWPGKGDGWEMF